MKSFFQSLRRMLNEDYFCEKASSLSCHDQNNNSQGFIASEEVKKDCEKHVAYVRQRFPHLTEQEVSTFREKLHKEVTEYGLEAFKEKMSKAKHEVD